MAALPPTTLSLSPSSTAPNPTPTPSCPNSQTSIHWNTTLPAIGEVCQITLSPRILSIQACCKRDAQVFIQGDCIQYCETEEKNFMDCVTQQLKANKIEYNTLGSICQGRGKSSSSVASSSVSQTSGTVRASASASSTGVGSAGVLTKNYGAGYTFAMLTAGIAVGFGVLGLL